MTVGGGEAKTKTLALFDKLPPIGPNPPAVFYSTQGYLTLPLTLTE